MVDFKIEFLFDDDLLNKTLSIDIAKERNIVKAVYEYFINILEGFEGDIIAFDIVYPSPETGEYNFISFYRKGEFQEKVQDFAKTDYYRNNILSLSSILIEERLKKNCSLRLKDAYKDIVVIKRTPEAQVFISKDKFIHPYGFESLSQDKLQNLENYFDIELKNREIFKALKRLADVILRTIVGNLEEVDCDYKSIVEGFARYLEWIRILADWRMYVYISVNISEDYNFGLVLILKNYHANIREKAERIIDRLKEKFIKDFAEYFLKKLRKKAIVNAMATIMSRNMSHNIGSHILFYINSRPSLEVYNIADISRFMAYLQQRMDFIAYISTGEWLPMGSIHFLIKDIISNFLKQKILLKYIGFSEGVDLNNLKINVYMDNEKVITLDKGEVKETSRKDVTVFIPLGVVGFQALYSILENIIRNSAKYGFATQKDTKELEINIKIFQDEKDVFLEISDNVSRVDNKKKKEIEAEILKPILSETGDIDLKNWGLKEIKICSFFLNSFDRKNYNIEKLKERIEPSMSPVCIDTEKEILTYKIKLMKGKEIYYERRSD